MFNKGAFVGKGKCEILLDLYYLSTFGHNRRLVYFQRESPKNTIHLFMNMHVYVLKSSISCLHPKYTRLLHTGCAEIQIRSQGHHRLLQLEDLSCRTIKVRCCLNSGGPQIVFTGAVYRVYKFHFKQYLV
jgi:hypothetical protein